MRDLGAHHSADRLLGLLGAIDAIDAKKLALMNDESVVEIVTKALLDKACVPK